MTNPWNFSASVYFSRSKRILDTQARDFLARFADKFSQLVDSDEGLSRILDCLGIFPNGQIQKMDFVVMANQMPPLKAWQRHYSGHLLSVRESQNLPKALLKRNPEQRVNIFRLLCFVEDGSKSSDGLMVSSGIWGPPPAPVQLFVKRRPSNRQQILVGPIGAE